MLETATLQLLAKVVDLIGRRHKIFILAVSGIFKNIGIFDRALIFSISGCLSLLYAEKWIDLFSGKT